MDRFALRIEPVSAAASRELSFTFDGLTPTVRIGADIYRTSG